MLSEVEVVVCRDEGATNFNFAPAGRELILCIVISLVTEEQAALIVLFPEAVTL